MKTEQNNTELGKSQKSSEDTNNTNYSENIRVEDTPFSIRMADELDVFVAMGKYRLTEKMTLKQAYEWTKIITWDKITMLLSIIVAETESVKEELKNLDNMVGAGTLGKNNLKK